VLDAVAARCSTGHHFDRGRGGHLNLQVGGRLGSSATSGDTAESLAARRRFLRAGHYAPIAAAVAAAVGEVDGPVLDVGCGEGWYLSQLPVAPGAGHGLDISKAAVQMAARAYPDSQFVVGTAYRLPVLDRSLERVVSVFAPQPFDEFARALRPGGRWVVATPGPTHLREMRPVREGEAADREAERLARRSEPPPGATRVEHVQRTLHLDAAAAHDLYAMTPIRYQRGGRVAGAGEARAGGADAPEGPATVTVDVWVASGDAAVATG